MNAQMIKTVQDRIGSMMKDSKIIELMNQFSTAEAVQEYIIKAAVATLIIPQNER
jgi:hypothetical protein